MKNKKGNISSITIILLIMLITIGLIGWMITKKSSVPMMQSLGFAKEVKQIDAPAGWETYVNNKHGYSIGYPADWKIEDYKTETIKDFLDDDISFTNPKSIGLSNDIDDGNKGNLKISVFSNFKSPKPGLIKDKTVPTIGQWKAGTVQRPGATVGPSEFMEDEKVAGMRCAVNKIPWHFQKYCVKDGKSYLFSVSFSGDGDGDIAMGEKIISTFKFAK